MKDRPWRGLIELQLYQVPLVSILASFVALDFSLPVQHCQAEKDPLPLASCGCAFFSFFFKRLSSARSLSANCDLRRKMNLTTVLTT